MPLRHHDDHIDFKLDLECTRLGGGAREQAGEHHVDGQGEVATYVPVRDLDVLDFGGFFRKPVRAATRFHAHKLQLNRADVAARLLYGELAEERFVDVADGVGQPARDAEGRDLLDLACVLQRLRRDDKVQATTFRRLAHLALHNELQLALQVLGQQRARQRALQVVADVDKYAMIRLVHRLALQRDQLELKRDFVRAVCNFAATREVHRGVHNLQRFDGVVERIK
mmetsp:Transcript_45659/g.114886  ORF Transcript_45659/g.114886 Transcript_45659/m.114886 type:complete len:226 (-) Transcript_45659:259-936(-)